MREKVTFQNKIKHKNIVMEMCDAEASYQVITGGSTKALSAHRTIWGNRLGKEMNTVSPSFLLTFQVEDISSVETRGGKTLGIHKFVSH